MAWLRPLPLLLISASFMWVEGYKIDSSASLHYTGNEEHAPVRTYPGMDGFPHVDDFKVLYNELDGTLISPLQEDFPKYSTPYNLRVIGLPYVIVVAKSIQDVQKAMLFAKKFNLMVSIRSSGHDYNGRSSYPGSMMINFQEMKGRTVNLTSSRNPAGEITVETGNSWLEVYEEVDKLKTIENGTSVGRVVVGGSAHTVAMGGYTMGGGHSPIGRQFGLAVDNLLEAQMVLADGSIATVSDSGTKIQDVYGIERTSSDNSLFWALRGGGGATWGAVVTFTFKLHYAPKRYRNVMAAWVLRIPGYDKFGRDTIEFVLKQMDTFCPQWGGYFMVSNTPLPPSTASGTLTVFLNHGGSDSDPCNKDVEKLLSYNISGNQYVALDRSFNTFLEYEKNAQDPPSSNTYIVNTFVQPESVEDPKILEELTDIIMNLKQNVEGCTGTFIGGNMKNVPDGATPINPAFRRGLLALTCGDSWDYSFTNDTTYDKQAIDLGEALRKVGKGTYYNECGYYMTDWKQLYWGNEETYCRLAEVKKKYDRDNFLWCHNCVGSDQQLDCPVKNDTTPSDWWIGQNTPIIG